MANFPKFDGTSEVTASVLNLDLVASYEAKTGHTDDIAEDFTFYPLEDITVSINGSDPIFIGAEDVQRLKGIYSFILLEADKNYRFQAQYETYEK